MYPFYLYNPVIELPQPVIIPIKSVEYFVLKNEAKQLNAKSKSALKMHNIAHSGQKENKSGFTEFPRIKIHITFVFPKPVINHDFKKKVDLAKKRNRKLKEEARNVITAPKSFEQLKTENLEDLVNEYEQEHINVYAEPFKNQTLSEWVIAKKAAKLTFERKNAEQVWKMYQRRPIIRLTLSEWVIAKKAAELTFERKNAEQVWKMYQQKAIDWDKESAKLLKQKTKELDMIGLDDLYERTHNMRDVVNAFNQMNR